MHPHPFELSPVARQIWEDKYRLHDKATGQVDRDVDDTWQRIARAAAASEPGGKRKRAKWVDSFHEAMAEFEFLPAGRIIAGAGTDRNVTLFNCFVMGEIDDDLSAIFENVKEAALTMQQGGGIGHDFSTLRPKGALVTSIGADASGPVSFMDVWDAMCRTIMSAGARRGAMMGTLRCDHPDVELFIDAKSDPERLRNFNVSVLITDDFMKAVGNDDDWDLRFAGKTWRTVRARDLWDRIMRATYHYAEPGVVFIDRINANNNLSYCETLQCTNPCGEQPLPPYGACLLGSINLPRLIKNPFASAAAINSDRLTARVHTAIRLLDNIIDASNYPLPAQRKEAIAKRRIGLGLTGLADALAMCGKRYGTPEAATLAGDWMKLIQTAAYQASVELAAEKGVFPLFEADAFAKSPNVLKLDDHLQADIRKHGIRNGCLTSIAPTGTISLLAGNVSSGIEPVFATSYRRRILRPDGSAREIDVEDYAVALYRKLKGEEASLPDTFVTAQDLSPREHLDMQAAVQPFVDSSISKTINCPADISFETFKSIYSDAYTLGLKGCTTFRPNDVTGSVLATNEEPPAVAAPPMVYEASEAPAPTASSIDDHAAVVMLTKPLDRDHALPGYTYKLKWPSSPDAIYVTINDIEHNGRRRPFEIFINTKNLEHYAWTVALTRMISAVFRRGGDVSFVVEELKAIFDPQGGRWMNGRYVPSLLAAIGEVIEGHMIQTGFLKNDDVAQLANRATAQSPIEATKVAAEELKPIRFGHKSCPQCGSRSLVRQEGCWVCNSCGYSHCG
ncbi:MAG: adenosylcobalamin-dependent ribonucleoside-diphosphate reductase [Hyphomicrobiaceae bacterium]